MVKVSNNIEDTGAWNWNVLLYPCMILH